jgi:hypothetical protein
MLRLRMAVRSWGVRAWLGVEAEVETWARRRKAKSRLGGRGLGWAWHVTARE